MNQPKTMTRTDPYDKPTELAKTQLIGPNWFELADLAQSDPG